MAFYTAIVMVALAAFVGIFGVYSRAQSLTHTQASARSVLDVVVKDLRTAQTVRYYPQWNSIASDGVQNPMYLASNFPPNNYNTNMRGRVRDYYCISSSSGQKGYANLWNVVANRYVLIRMPQGCDTFAGYEMLVDGNVWSDATATANLAELNGIGYARPSDPVSDPGALHLDTTTGKDYRGLVISRLGTADPAIWKVQVSVYSGKRVPPAQSNLLDQFSASTTLQTIVTTRL